MVRGRPGEQYHSWITQKRHEREAEAEQRTRLLPPGLQQDLLEACEREREAVLERMDVLDQSIENLDKMRAEVGERVRAAARRADPERTVTKRGLDGTEYEVTRGSDGRLLKTPAAIEEGKLLRKLDLHKRACESEKRRRLRELTEIRNVERATERGIVPGLLHVVSGWTNRVEIGGLAERAKMGRSYWADAAGNRLPDTALGEDGEPADYESAKQARETAEPLTV